MIYSLDYATSLSNHYFRGQIPMPRIEGPQDFVIFEIETTFIDLWI